MGEVYVEVTGEVANNGIMTLSGSDPEGGSGGTYRINWTGTGGFTGQGWLGAWNSSNVPLQKEWSQSPAEHYSNTYDGFITYVTSSGSIDLTQWLDGAGWTNDQKYAFAHDEYPNIWMDCTTPS
ncbi:MAG: hypothetical protein ACOX8E_08570 [Ruminococcus sp.]